MLRLGKYGDTLHPADHGRAKKQGSKRRFWVVFVLGFCLLAGQNDPPLVAQRNQPIYPAYDGFLKNPDGSYTLAFAYFSHNAEVVTVPPGPDNSFTPSPMDRQQPTVFKPGHWRFQCVMVVGPEFDGKMIWKLGYAGTTTGTSERMLQSNWNLVEGAPDLSRLEYAKVPRGVCLNRAPIVRLLGKTARKGEVSIDATSGRNFTCLAAWPTRACHARAHDRRVEGCQRPGNRDVFEPRLAPDRGLFTAPGIYALELSATDSELSSTLRVVVTVSEPAPRMRARQ